MAPLGGERVKWTVKRIQTYFGRPGLFPGGLWPIILQMLALDYDSILQLVDLIVITEQDAGKSNASSRSDRIRPFLKIVSRIPYICHATHVSFIVAAIPLASQLLL